METVEVQTIVGLLRDLLKVARLSKQRWSSAYPAAPAGLVATLGMIYESGDCHAKELAARAGLDPSTVSRAVAAMVGQGLVERRADPADGRASVLAVTDHGMALLRDSQAWFAGVLQRAVAGWPPDEVHELGVRLGRFRTAVEDALTDNTREAAR